MWVEMTDLSFVLRLPNGRCCGNHNFRATRRRCYINRLHPSDLPFHNEFDEIVKPFSED